MNVSVLVENVSSLSPLVIVSFFNDNNNDDDDEGDGYDK